MAPFNGFGDEWDEAQRIDLEALAADNNLSLEEAKALAERFQTWRGAAFSTPDPETGELRYFAGTLNKNRAKPGSTQTTKKPRAMPGLLSCSGVLDQINSGRPRPRRHHSN